jgi:hypothetical protein
MTRSSASFIRQGGSKAVGWSCVVFFAVFLMYSLWIWQGFDVTDEGFHLVRQWSAFTGSGQQSITLTWLGDWLGGAWLWVTRGLGLFGARLGWALWNALTALVTFWVLRQYSADGRTAGAVVGTAAVLGFWGLSVLDYNAVPVLFLVGGAGLSLLAQRPGQRLQKAVVSSVFSGALLAVAVACRSPAIVAVVAIPGVAAIARLAVTGRPQARSFFLTGVSISAAVAILAIGVALLGIGAEWFRAVADAASATEGSHTLGALVGVYYHTFLAALREGGIAFAWIGIAISLVVVVLRQAKRGRSLVFALFGAALALHLLTRHGTWDTYYGLLLGFTVWLTLVVGVLFAVSEHIDCERGADILALLGVGTVIAMAAVLGSNNGVLAAKFGLWLLFPGAFLAAAEVADVFARRHPKWGLQAARTALVVVMVCLAAVGVWTRATGTYRDLRNPLKLTSAISHPQLRYVFTSRQRAESIGALLEQIELRAVPGDPLLAWDSLPMIHFVTGTKPALGDAWPNLLPDNVLSARLQEMWAAGGPAVAVVATVDPRNPMWAVEDTAAPQRSGIDIESELRAHGYAEAWMNGQFTLWVRRPLDGQVLPSSSQ